MARIQPGRTALLGLDMTDLPDAYTQEAPFQYWDDTATSEDYSYSCEAPAGTATSAAGWRISRYEYATGKLMYPDGNTNYDNVADDRASLTYSFTKT